MGREDAGCFGAITNSVSRADGFFTPLLVTAIRARFGGSWRPAPSLLQASALLFSNASTASRGRGDRTLPGPAAGGSVEQASAILKQANADGAAIAPLEKGETAEDVATPQQPLALASQASSTSRRTTPSKHS